MFLPGAYHGKLVKNAVKIHFAPCFDEQKILKIAEYLPATYAELDRLAPWVRGRWPKEIRCMSDAEIVDGRSRGAGHGFVYTDRASSIWMNPFMSWQGHLLVLIHENIHVAWPDMTENEVNCSMLPKIWKTVMGKKLEPAWARQHGIGAPAPYGDRSYCR